ncbi:uncharacterized protein RHOBADRAFT_51140 [Rhodotorula graminis WP1]|uniref:TAFII28-like protein domain-containing protein n=1 Tax=Rhodotorula graminis (strain WP1) TaxID=578459 RepID=A0A194SGB5_RHOGW|nr:uncharacterized protein RHOBADRAFT_51140 [Rhodotorula graminis WP1]KPV78706.1 hypothetical protein RHOBADRAFT_51140 [Rhodotorula graminis WP1]
MKRALSTAGSPPPASAPKPKKPRAARPRKPTKKAQAAAAAAAAAAGGDAGSPGASGADSPFPVGASSPPAASASAVGSPARGRSASVAVEGGAGRGRAGTAEEGGAAGAEPGPPQGEAEEPEDAEDEFGSNQREAAKQKEDVRVLLDHFDEAQNDRYDTYRRSGLNKGSVKKVVNQVLGQSVSQSIVTVVRGVAKVFVGELVEKARAVNPHAGSLTPQDLREAYRLYLEEHEGAGMGGATRRKKLFVR